MIMHSRRHRYVGSLVLMLTVIILLVLPVTNAGGQARPAEKAQEGLGTGKNAAGGKWGIRVVSLRLSANNYMLDFRYRVNDPEKAKPFFDRRNKPYVIDQASGAKLLVPAPPKIGALRQTRGPEAGKNYFILFGNPGGTVRPGSKVTVVVGDVKIENLIVE